MSTGAGTFVSSVKDLAPDVIYYLRAYATNSVGTGYRNEIKFGTLQLRGPVLTTSSVTSITQTTAKGGGTITDASDY